MQIKMPELPEVETVLRTLEGMIKDRRIEDILVLYPKIIEDDIDDFKHKLIGQSFRNFKRRGKYLIFEMDDLALISHLRMEGKYFYLDSEKPYDKHVHIIFKLDNGKTLQYHDVRKFGRMYLSPIKDKYEIADLGPEPFDRSFNVTYAKRYLAEIKRPIKEVLLDQHFVAGIGNIYANEILFASGVHPESICLKLDDEDIHKIVSNTKKILKKAIKAGGTTIRSYTSSLGVTGRFQLSLMVHGRDKQECLVCGTTIKKIKVGGRGTYYCEKCQILKK